MEIFDIQKLTFRYAGSQHNSLDGIDLKINEGEFLLICGTSGCGKTTFLKNFKTVLRPFGKKKGDISYKGIPIDDVPARTQAEEIGYVLQKPDDQIVTDKVWHELAFGMENLGFVQQEMRDRIAEMAGFFGIHDWYHKDVKDLSGGQKQILSLAAAMTTRPRALILDEPTASLDPIASENFLESLGRIHTELGTTIMITEHRLDRVFPMADRVMVMEKGKCIALARPSQIPGMIRKNVFFSAMPVTARIYDGIVCYDETDSTEGSSVRYPLTVLEGRRFMEKCVSGRDDSIDKTGIKAGVSYEAKIRSAAGDIQYAAEASGVWFRYEKDSTDVLRSLNILIPENKITCILGGNGTGKSTMLSVLAGLRKPHHGKVRIFGKEIRKWDPGEFFGKTAVLLPQDPQTVFLKDTVKEDLMSALRSDKRTGRSEKEKKINEAAELTGISHLLGMHPYDLSGGEQQRAAICKMLLKEPRLFFMDEPTKGFDDNYKKMLGDLFVKLKKKGMTIVMVSHDLEFCAGYGDLCGMFFDGNVISLETPQRFFGENTFYTTVARRITRGIADRDRYGNYMITAGDVIREFGCGQKE